MSTLPTAAQPTDRLTHIDALRGLAALLVVWYHADVEFTGVSGSFQSLGDVATALRFGDLGVYLFFLLSGFVIPTSFDRPGGRGEVVRVFLVRRFFRLFPLYWLTIPLGLLSVWVLAGHAFGWQLVAANLTMIPEYLGSETIVRPYWTLAPELVFYCLCVCLFLLGVLRPTGGIVAAGLVLLALFLAGYFPFADGTPLANWHVHEVIGQLSLMLTGTSIRRWYDGQSRTAGVIAGSAILVAFWLAGASLFLGNPAYAIAMVLFLTGVFAVRISMRAAVGLGVASYSLYLIHEIVFSALMWVLEQPAAVALRGLPFPLYALVAGGLSVSLALILYRLVERPAIAAGRRLTEPARVPEILAINNSG